VAQAPETPVAPSNVIRSECLEVTAPDGWSLHSSETHRTQIIAGGQSVAVTYSVMRLRHESGREITLMHPHGTGAYAEAAFRISYLRVTQMLASRGFPAFLATRGIASMQVGNPASVSAVPGGRMFIITTTEQDGTVEHGRVMIMPLDRDDPDSRIMVSTNVPAADDEQFPAEALEIVRSLRNTCE
jgi:hypothetical protein